MVDPIGHIGYLFIFFGIISIARKKAYGWLLRFIGEFIWVALGIHLGLTSIWIWGVVFIIIDLYGYVSWKYDLVKK